MRQLTRWTAATGTRPHRDTQNAARDHERLWLTELLACVTKLHDPIMLCGVDGRSDEAPDCGPYPSPHRSVQEMVPGRTISPPLRSVTTSCLGMYLDDVNVQVTFACRKDTGDYRIFA